MKRGNRVKVNATGEIGTVEMVFLEYNQVEVKFVDCMWVYGCDEITVLTGKELWKWKYNEVKQRMQKLRIFKLIKKVANCLN